MAINRIIKSKRKILSPLCLLPYALCLLSYAFCLMPLLTQSQSTDEIKNIHADSLQQALSQLSGTKKIDTLNKIAFSIAKDFPDSCRKLATQTISMPDSMNYLKGLADGYRNLGDSYIVQDSLLPRMINYLKAVSIYEQMDPSIELASVYIMLSWMNNFAGRFRSAINYDRKAIKAYKQGKTIEDIEYRYASIALVYQQLGEYDSAIFYNKIALSYADSNLKSFPNNTFGIIYRYKFYESGDTSMLDKSVEWLIKGLNSPVINHHRTAAINANLFHAYYAYGNKGKDSLALYHAKQVIPSAVKSKDAYYIISGSWMKMGLLLKRDCRYDSAIICYNKTLHIIDSAQSSFSMKGYTESYYGMQEKLSLRRKKSEAYYLLYDVYSTIGDYKKALEYYINYKNARENIYREDNKNLIAMIEAESENEKTSNQIAGLERDKQINELKVAQTRNLNIVIVVVFVIVLLVGILFLRQNKLKNEHKNTLLEQNLLRLQMNPHFIFNALSSIHSLMNPKDVNKASDYLGNFSRLLRSSLESSREDYILLEDEINSIKNYLELQRLRYDEKFNYKIDVDPEIDLESAILSPMLIQPFIENAIEHGIRHKEDHGNIYIRFKLESKNISCEIEDDGVGREKAWEVEYAKKEKHKSLATEIIRDRIKILNKKIKQKISLEITDLRSEANEAIGTMVRLDLPYLLD